MASTPPPPPPEPFRIPGPPPPPQGPWRKFRAAPMWAQILAWGAATFIVLIIIGVAVGPAEDETAASASTTRSATSSNLIDSAAGATPPTTQQAAPAPEPTPLPQEVDTGRMSDGEYQFSVMTIDEANDEMVQYFEALGGECAALFSALEVAAAFDCVKEGYEGVEGDLSGVVAQMESVRRDVDKQCRVAVDRLFKVANVPLFRALRSSRDSFLSVDVPNVQRRLARLRVELDRWSLLVREFRVECAPA